VTTGVGDGGRRRPLYTRGCRRPQWREGATAVVHDSRDLTPVDHGGRVLRGPQPVADRWRSPYRCGSRRLEVRLPWAKR
jgi:hypothetical protein